MLPNAGLTKAMVEAEQISNYNIMDAIRYQQFTDLKLSKTKHEHYLCITDNDFVLRVLNHALKHVSALKQSSWFHMLNSPCWSWAIFQDIQLNHIEHQLPPG